MNGVDIFSFRNSKENGIRDYVRLEIAGTASVLTLFFFKRKQKACSNLIFITVVGRTAS